MPVLATHRWLWWQDSNLRVAESKSAVLPLDDTTIWSNQRGSNPYHQFGRLRCCHYTMAAFGHVGGI